MTDAATYLALAERVEKLTGPDREVDAEIAAACRIGAPAWGLDYADGPPWRGGADGIVHLDDEGLCFNAPSFTGSLDAAASLVPEGLWAEGSLGTHNSTRSALEIHGPGTFDPVGKAWAATPALALTAASLRALASTAQGNQ